MMNNRIKELMTQTLDKKFSYTWTVMDYQDIEVFSEQFAELIVRECLLKVNGAKIRGESMDELITRIKEDFGVEE